MPKHTNNNRGMLVFLIFLSVSLFVALYGCKIDEGPEEIHLAGELDSSFGGNGIVITSIDSRSDANAVVVQPDGKIVVAGSASDGITSRIVLARYQPDGSLDHSFGLSRIVETSIDSSSSASAMVLQPDGTILVTGSASDGTTSRIVLARYQPNGSLDITFGSGGIVTTSIGSSASANDLAIQLDGKIVAVGSTAGESPTQPTDTTVVRYTPDGSLDTALGRTGIVTTSISSLDDSAYALAIQPDGTIVTVGYARTVHLSCDGRYFWQTDFTLVRYPPNGSSYTTERTDMGAIGDDVAIALAVQPDGKILAAGSASDRRFQDFSSCLFLCFCSLTTEEIEALVLPMSFAL